MTEMVLKETSLKKAKLAKTRSRREALAKDRRVAERQGDSSRNDLLPDLEIRQFRISDLRPPRRRTRKDDRGQIDRLVRSISQFGFSFPILVRDGQVVDGWSRVLAAIEMGLDRVPAIDCTHLDDEEARALALALMPPRSLKSFLASICLPAWILGHQPGEKIVCASYAQKLSEDFAFETRRLMQSDWYRRVFPETHLDPKKCNVEVLATTRGGQRRATSVGGSLTGMGGNLVIIDDPIKAADAHSETARESAIKWYGGTVASRLDDPKKGRIIVIAQRLHMDDLPGQLLAQGGWKQLELPLIEWQDREIEIDPGKYANRGSGNLLHEERIGEEEIARLKSEMGERDFEAQYNQRPMPPGGALFKGEWLKRYSKRPYPHHVQGIFQSWDTAYDIEEQHDYSACSTWALSGSKYYLLDVYREKLEFPDLEKAIYRLQKEWKADLVVVERVGSGLSVAQNIRRGGKNRWLEVLTPEGSKQDRASQQTPKFERGEVILPEEAPWLKTFENELLSFPHAKHDDQVDSVVQFLAAVDTERLLIMADQARRL